MPQVNSERTCIVPISGLFERPLRVLSYSPAARICFYSYSAVLLYWARRVFSRVILAASGRAWQEGDITVKLPIPLGNQCRDKIGPPQPSFLQVWMLLAPSPQGIVP